MKPDKRSFSAESAKYRTICNYVWRESEGTGGKIKVPYDGPTEEMIAEGKHFGVLQYESCKAVLFVLDDPDTFVTSSSDLKAVLYKQGVALTFSKTGSVSVQDLLASYTAGMGTNVYNRLSLIPEFPPDKKTFYFPYDYQPRQTGKLRVLADALTVRDEQSRINIVATWLSQYLPRKFDGKIPMHMTLAPMQSSGKSTIMLDVTKMLTGRAIIMLNQQAPTNENSYGSLQAQGHPFAIWDNITSLSEMQASVIAKTVTASSVEARLYYVGRPKIPNNKVYALNFNNEERVNRDILARAIITYMLPETDITPAKRLELDNLFQDLQEEPKDLIEDCLYYVANPKTKNIPKYTAPAKYSLWAERIVPILSNIFPEVEHFNFALREEDLRLDKRGDTASTALDSMLEDAEADGVVITAAALLNKYWKPFHPNFDSTTTPQAMGRYINGHKKSLIGINILTFKPNPRIGTLYAVWRTNSDVTTWADWTGGEPRFQVPPLEKDWFANSPDREQLPTGYTTALESNNRKADANVIGGKGRFVLPEPTPEPESESKTHIEGLSDAQGSLAEQPRPRKRKQQIT